MDAISCLCISLSNDGIFCFHRLEDPHLALTSQTLNPDGTPKRPMNAFMIFARKRRPQISAANQMMRTGDISKILSKEWNTMDMVSRRVCLAFSPKSLIHLPYGIIVISPRRNSTSIRPRNSRTISTPNTPIMYTDGGQTIRARSEGLMPIPTPLRIHLTTLMTLPLRTHRPQTRTPFANRPRRHIIALQWAPRRHTKEETP